MLQEEQSWLVAARLWLSRQQKNETEGCYQAVSAAI